jgi:hypothetical protein
MANIVKKNLEKGAVNAVIVGLSAVLTQLIVTGLAQLNVNVDSMEIKMAVVTILSATLAGLENWWSHRAKKPAKITPVNPA